MNYLQAHDYFGENAPYSEFYINSCGYFIEIDIKTGTHRPDGRADYQLLYVTEGVLYTIVDGVETENKAGSLILYKPGEPQHYFSEGGEVISYFWIHFSGRLAGSLLEQCLPIGEGRMDFPVSQDDVRIITQMIEEINRKIVGYQMKLMSLFIELLTNMSRRMAADRKNLQNYMRLQKAIRSMEQASYRNFSVKEFAQMCNMSENHFAHVFKEVTGKAPMQYRDDLRMEKAAALLAHTDMPVSGVAEYVGFEDALYFSRRFKKYFKVSPTKYRGGLQLQHS